MPEMTYFYTTDARVYAGDMSQGGEKAHDPQWSVRYAPKDEDDTFRFLTGTLHCAADDVQVTVSVGAILEDTGVEYEEADFRDLLDGADALNVLFHTARNAAKVLVALTDGELIVPEAAPIAKISLIEMPDDEMPDDEMPDDSETAIETE